MGIDKRVVDDLGEYFKAINEIEGEGVKNPQVLWFRGISDIQYSLIPSLFRKKTRTDGAETDYSKLHYAEDIRTQHYIAKNHHFFHNEPSSRVEWLETMQHHRVNTRALDWSESSVHSLLFAVEMFLDDEKYKRQQRDEAVPCVWVLEPAALNRKIFRELKDNMDKPEISSLLDDLVDKEWEKERILENIRRFSKFDIYDETDETRHLDYILNLSAIDDELLRDQGRMKRLLLKGDVVNPYYYLISRIYSDGHVLRRRVLPPLAIVQPYHSERIKAQRGVLTIFPFYEEKKYDKKFRKLGFNPDAMDNNNYARGVLHQIVIGNPRKVAYELLHNGMSDSWLYPEMPVVSSEIENHRIF